MNFLSVNDLQSVGYSLLIGASNKRFLGTIVGSEAIKDRHEGTLTITALAALHGIGYVRVHDVRSNVRVVRTIDAISATL